MALIYNTKNEHHYNPISRFHKYPSERERRDIYQDRDKKREVDNTPRFIVLFNHLFIED